MKNVSNKDLLQRIKKLEEAIRPFADSDMRFRYETGHCETVDALVAGVADFTVGDLIDANEALYGKGQGK